MKPSLLLPLLVLAATLPAQQKPQQKPPQSHEELFGLDKIWDIHLTVGNRAWTLMVPEGGRMSGMAGRKYLYIGAHVRIAGHEDMRIGLRFKGASTFMMTTGSLKRSFKLDFNRYDKKQTFLGLKKLSLNNNATDGTQIREAISYDVFRSAGIPGSRTAFARVYLTIKGKLENTYLGLYTIIEQADRDMFKRQLRQKTTILKPQGRMLPYYGEEWDAQYEQTYNAKTKVSKKAQDLLVRLSGIAEDERRLSRSGRKKTPEEEAAFVRSLERVMDVDGFLEYVAINSILANWDNPLNLAHNVYVVVPKTGKITWVPWDLNLSMSFGRFQGASAVKPTARSLPLANSILATEKYMKAYRKHIAQLLDGACSAKELTRRIEICRKTTNAAIAEEASRPAVVMQATEEFGATGSRRTMPDRFRTKQDLIEVMTKRVQWVRDELDGKVVARPRTTGRTRTRRIILDSAGLLKGLMLVGGALTPDQTYNSVGTVAAAPVMLARFDKDQSKTLEVQELRAAAQEFIQKQGARSPFSSGPSTYARALRREMDSDKDGTVSSDELKEACQNWFPAWDADQNGKLEKNELAVVVASPSSRR